MNSSNDLSNKTIVITGGTSGVGKETARELAKRNATLVIIARN
ncbi:MAG: SDR family NAD(P)-dependent oxidoreductase, partial [Candidatus Heimdallarchaeota archaeon]